MKSVLTLQPVYDPAAGKVPPHDLDAEGDVLEACFMRLDKRAEILTILRQEHFYSDANGWIFEAIRSLTELGRGVDTSTVGLWLRDHGRLETAGGAPYLCEIVNMRPGTPFADQSARTVRGKWRVRQLIATCQRIAAEGYGPVGDIEAWVDEQEAAFLRVTENDQDLEEVPTMAELIQRRATHLIEPNEAEGLATGLIDLDRLMGPMRPGNMVVIAAHSGIGKTSLAMQIAMHNAMHGRVETEAGPALPGIFVASQEMTDEELTDRAVLAALTIDTSRGGRLKDGEKTDLAGFAERVATGRHLLNLWIDDRGSATPLQLRARARRHAAKGRQQRTPLRLIVVDYIQLCDGSEATARNHERRERELAYVSSSLKSLAKELKAVVVVVAQLNEDARREKRLPKGEDLRECKAIRADADKVLLLNNSLAEERRIARRMGEDIERSIDPEIVDIILDKNRGGKEGRVCAVFRPSLSTFGNITREDFEAHLAAEAAERRQRLSPRARA